MFAIGFVFDLCFAADGLNLYFVWFDLRFFYDWLMIGFSAVWDAKWKPEEDSDRGELNDWMFLLVWRFHGLISVMSALLIQKDEGDRVVMQKSISLFRIFPNRLPQWITGKDGAFMGCHMSRHFHISTGDRNLWNDTLETIFEYCRLFTLSEITMYLC